MNTFAIRMSTTNDEILGQNYWIYLAAMESNMIRDMFLIECRAFGARFIPCTISRPYGRA